MARDPPAKTDPIIIVGSGIFGLSTALHLCRRGYRDVTVFDRLPYDESQYSYFKGADSASADINKIIRSAYGSQTEYQDLSTEAIAAWQAWNAELAAATDADLPPGMKPGDAVFVQNCNTSFSTAAELPDWELACIEGMERAGHRDTQLATTDARHRRVAREKGVAFAMDPFRREARGKPNVAVVDSTGGMAVADKACRFALHKARALGAKFVFGDRAGALEALLREDEGEGGKKVVGIRTRDGAAHTAALTVLACGAWTPVLLPQLDGLCEATAGSVALLRIPRESGLWERLGPGNFPTFTWDLRGGAAGGVYGFPRDEEGWFKVGYRGSKYTNPLVQGDGRERSTPATRFSPALRDGAQPVGDVLTAFPEQAHKVITDFLDEYLPELAEEGIGISYTRICWYTDSFDNHFVVDRVPETEGLMVATGGSGHAFKYLPNVGNWVVDVIENVDTDRPAIKAWRWRVVGGEKPVNSLMEGSKGPRALDNVSLLEEAVVSPSSSSRL
ncbi:putative sarcosine oxidase [Biscogniauxia sp. FL1348]|nr:putative sarcosine oxidase [Biscogniauxia sp. FL1348]